MGIKEVDFSRVTDEDRKFAQYLRGLASRIDSGEVTDCVVVFNDRENACYERYASFNDRWRILAAIEYAKDAVHRAGD